MLDPAIFKYTKANVALVSDRVHNVHAPQGEERPYIVFEVTNTNFVNSMGGDSGLAESPVRFHVFGDTKDSVNNVIAQLKTTYRNYFSSSNMSGEHLVQTTMLNNEANMRYERDTKLFHGILDVIFWHTE